MKSLISVLWLLFSMNCFADSIGVFKIDVVLVVGDVCKLEQEKCTAIQQGDQLLSTDKVKVVDDQALFIEYRHPVTLRKEPAGVFPLHKKDFQPVLLFIETKKMASGLIAMEIKSVKGGSSRSDFNSCQLLSDLRLPANWNKTVLLNAYDCELSPDDEATLIIHSQSNLRNSYKQTYKGKWGLKTEFIPTGRYTIDFFLNSKKIHSTDLYLTEFEAFARGMRAAVSKLESDKDVINNIGAAYMNNYLAVALYYKRLAENKFLDPGEWGRKAMELAEQRSGRPNLMIEIK